jgi:HEAT repeat protein
MNRLRYVVAICLSIALCAQTQPQARARISALSKDKPDSAQLWIKRLRDPRHVVKATRELQRINDPAAITPLCSLFQDFERTDTLEAIISLMKRAHRHKGAIATLISTLTFTEDKYHSASLAAAALAEHGAREAVLPLAAIVDRPMAIKSRANLAKKAAIEALARLKDRRAVPHLIRAVERPPSRQDFLLNKRAAFALGEIGDPRAAPALVRALFMASTIQGTSYPQARVALIKLGRPALRPLVRAMEGKEPRLNAMTKRLKFRPGLLLGRTARVLGQLRDPAAAPPLLRQLRRARTGGNDYTQGVDGVFEGLARIGDRRALPPLLKILNDPKANYKLRMQVCMAFTMMGAKQTLPHLLQVARTGTVPGGYLNLREAAAMAYGRIAGAEAVKGVVAVKQMARAPGLRAYKTTVYLFNEVVERLKVAAACKDDPVCYGRKLNDPRLSLAQREKAGIMIGILPGGRKALAALVKALPTREPILRLFFLESAKRIGTARDKALIKMLQQLVAKNSKRSKKYLSPDLYGVDAIALAVILRRP